MSTPQTRAITTEPVRNPKSHRASESDTPFLGIRIHRWGDCVSPPERQLHRGGPLDDARARFRRIYQVQRRSVFDSDLYENSLTDRQGQNGDVFAQTPLVASSILELVDEICECQRCSGNAFQNFRPGEISCLHGVNDRIVTPSGLIGLLPRQVNGLPLHAERSELLAGKCRT